MSTAPCWAVAGIAISVAAAVCFAVSLDRSPAEVVQPWLLLALAGGAMALSLAASRIVSGRAVRRPDLLVTADE